MSKAILTIVNGERIEAIWENVKPSFEAYADKVDADLIVLKQGQGNFPSPHWWKLAIYEFLKKDYKRLIYMDADIIIRPDCPNLFEVVPENEMALFNEGRFTPRSICIYEAQVKYGNFKTKYDGMSYYNTGVMVISREHRHIFKPVNEPINLRWAFGEQTYLNYRILNTGVKVHELDCKFNRLSIMNKWLGVSRLDSYIVHYAGEYDTKMVVSTIEKDLKSWEEKAPEYHYPPCVFLNIGGGLGDQVDCEPAIRYLSEKVYPDAEITVLTIYPELFSHLRVNVFKETPEMWRDAIYEVETHPSAYTPLRKYLSHLFCHGIDYASISMMRRILPNEHKTIKLVIPDEARKSVVDYNPHVLVHPGKTWDIRTFPDEWWEEVINGLSKKLKIAIIGKSIDADHGVTELGCPEGVIDLRNKLSLYELFAMLEKTPALVSNDSSPIHLAGAFDNHIYLITTCKHPSLLFPFRHGTQYYKTHSFYKKLLEDDYNFKPYHIEYKITGFPVDVNDYLPEPKEVIDGVLKTFITTTKKEFYSENQMTI